MIQRWKGVLGCGLALGVALSAGQGCGGKTEEAPVHVARPIATVVLSGGEGGSYTFAGQVQAADRSDISFRVSGRLIELPAHEGDEVRRGQVLARLDPRDYEVAKREAQAAYDKSEADAQRFQRLYERDAVPLADLELRRAERDVTKARLEQSELNLSYATLQAPYNGWIGRRYVENFQDVQAKEEIVSIQSLDRLEVVIDVPEYLMATARSSGEAVFHAQFTTAGDREFPLTVKEFSAQADIRTQTFQVTFSMPLPESVTILPGMTANVEMVLQGGDPSVEETSFVLPAYSVVGDTNGEPYVWIVDPDSLVVHKRVVELGKVTGTDQIWVTGGLRAGERIASTGVHQLQEGMKIRLMDN